MRSMNAAKLSSANFYRSLIGVICLVGLFSCVLTVYKNPKKPWYKPVLRQLDNESITVPAGPLFSNSPEVDKKKKEKTGINKNVQYQQIIKDELEMNDSLGITLEPGMVNVSDTRKVVTRGSDTTWRVVIIGYDDQLIPNGYNMGDIQPYMRSKRSSQWVQLTKDSVDSNKRLVYTKAKWNNEEPDFINGIIKVPENPDLFGYAPTMIKDIKVADPTTGISFIEPPVANNMGSANLSFPIDVPAGRGGLQPELNIAYNSDAGSDWMGEGWNLATSRISIETRWGPAKFNGTESETYLLDGEMLVFMHEDDAQLAHRSLNIPRKTDTVQFYTRKHVHAKRILRIGDNVNNYRWLVVDQRTGQKYYYGRSDDNERGQMQDALAGNRIIAWYLCRVEDLRGNYMSYRYEVITEPYLQTTANNIYLKEIRYNGNHTIKDGLGDPSPHNHNYSIRFITKKINNLDIVTNGRSGVLTGGNRLLDSIRIYLSFAPSTLKHVRSYYFPYKTGPFNKFLLAGIKVYGSEDSLFYYHDFSYHNESGIRNYFGGRQTWTIPESGGKGKLVRALDIADLNNKTVLGASRSSSSGNSFYIGLGPAGNPSLKDLTAGLQFGGSSSKSEGLSILMDMNGDNRKDYLYTTGNRMEYLENNGNGFNTVPVRLRSLENDNMSQFSNDITRTNNRSKQLVFGKGSIGIDDANSQSISSTYFTDVNADNLPDLYIDGKVLFNIGKVGNEHHFSRYSSKTEVPINAPGNFNDITYSDHLADQQAIIVANPLHEAVRVWEAPFDGQVQITAPIQLIDSRADPDFDPTKYDGIRATIQHGATELGSIIVRADFGLQVIPGIPASLQVRKGQRIYFRLQPGTADLANGAFDKVEWDPMIVYTAGSNLNDIFNKDEKVYRASTDYLLSSEGFRIDTSVRTIDLTWNFSKGYTQDNIKVELQQLRAVGRGANFRYEVERVIQSGDYGIEDTIDSRTVRALNVDPTDGRVFRYAVRSDVNIDLSNIQFDPIIHYEKTFNPKCEIAGNIVDCPNEPPIVKQKQIRGIPNFYFLDSLKIKREFWRIMDTATYSLSLNIHFADTIRSSGSIFFTLRDSSRILKKLSFPYEAGTVHTQPINLTVDLDSGMVVYCTYEIDDTEINDLVNQSFFEIGIASKNAELTITSTTPPVIRPGQSHVIRNAGRYFVRPYIRLNNNQTRGSIPFTINAFRNGVTEVLHRGVIKYGHDTLFYPRIPELNLMQNDVLSVSMTSTNQFLAVVEQGYNVNIFRTAELWVKRKDEKFGPMYRSWGQFVYSGMEGAAGRPIDERLLVLRTPSTGLQTDIATQGNTYGSMSQPQLEGSDVPELRGLEEFSPLTAKFSKMGAFIDTTGTVRLWMGSADDIYVGKTNSSASRLGIDDIVLVDPFNIRVATGPDNSVAYAVPRITKAYNRTFNAGYSPVSLNYSDTSRSITRMVSDFFDINGDRFPDMISPGTIKYSLPTGTLGPTGGNLLTHESKSGSIGIGMSAGFFHREATLTSRRYIIRPGIGTIEASAVSINASVNIGASGSYNAGMEEAQITWEDMNGDGLLDRTRKDGNVDLSLGNTRFTPQVHYDFVHVSRATNISVSPGVTLGININSNSISAGIGLSFSNARPTAFFEDLNGDGLRDHFILQNDGSVHVRLNTGSSFTYLGPVINVNDNTEILPVRFVPPVPLISDWRRLDKNRFNSSVGQSAGGSFTFGFTLPIPPIKMVFTPSFNKSNGIGKTVRQFADINGDGFLDYLYSTTETDLHIHFSLIGQTNKLSKVTRPLGGSFDIEYVHQSPGPQHPGGKWVMSSVKISDGISEDRVYDRNALRNVDFDSYHTFKYEKGQYDKYERDFLGFSEVIMSECNFDKTTLRRSTRTFDNRNYYVAGNLLKEVVTSADGSVALKQSDYEYYLKVVKPVGDTYSDTTTVNISQIKRYNGICFSGLHYERHAILDNGQRVGHEKEYHYDDKGNISGFYYSDNGGFEKGTYNYNTSIQQGSNPVLMKAGLFLNPVETVVRDAKGNLLRKSKAEYTDKGQLKTVSILLSKSGNTEVYASTTIEYNAFGSIDRVKFPPNHKGDLKEKKYEYDRDLKTYPTEIIEEYTVTGREKFSFKSTTEYNTLFYSPERLVDANKRTAFYEYDQFGRMKRMIGTNEVTDVTRLRNNTGFTIRVVYPKWNDNSKANSNYTLVTHFDPQYPAGLGIRTVNFKDGMGRSIQVKKSAVSRAGADEWIVSGRLNYNALGQAVENYYPTTNAGARLFEFDTATDLVNGRPKPTRTSYDLLDRVLVTRMPDNLVYSSITYSIRDGAGVSETVLMDSLGNPLRISEEHFSGSGQKLKLVEYKQMNRTQALTTKLVYDGINQLESVENALGKTTMRYKYDMAGRRIMYAHADGGTTTYTYDPAGNMIAKASAGTPPVRYEYEYNRVTHINYADPLDNVLYEYGSSDDDATVGTVGRVKRQSDASGTQNFEYDGMGNVSKIRRSIVVPFDTTYTFQTRFGYDSWNRLRFILYPDSERVNYSYNRAGLLTSVEGKKELPDRIFPYVRDIRYDKFEQKVLITYGNGVVSQYSYQPLRNRLAVYQSNNSKGSSFMKYGYHYDNIDNILKITNTSSGTGSLSDVSVQGLYEYDHLGRLTKANGSWVEKAKKDSNAYYDLILNYTDVYDIESKKLRMYAGTSPAAPGVVSKKTSESYLYANQDQFTTLSSITTDSLRRTRGKEVTADRLKVRTYAYDSKGNRISQADADKIGNRSYKDIHRYGLIWDDENRIRSINQNGYVSHYIYDASGNRTIKQSLELNTVYVNGEKAASRTRPSSATVYVNPYFSMRNGNGVYTKHIYIGEQRIASKLVDDDAFTVQAGSRPYWVTPVSEPGEHDYSEKITKHINSINSYYDSFHLERPLLSRTGFRNFQNKEDPAVVNPFIANKGNTIEEIDSDINENLRYWYHTNHLGHVNYVTDRAGMPVQYNEYLPYGEVFMEQRNNYHSRFSISGKERDAETGLIYFGARYYDPETYSWLGVDPKAEDFPKQSPYVYCMANPIVFHDPNGKWASQKLHYVHQTTNFWGVMSTNKGSLNEGWTKWNALNRATNDADADINQTAAKSHYHAMTDGTKPDQIKAKQEAKIAADRHVRDKFKKAAELFDAGKLEKAYYEFGWGLHTIQDATSPMHIGFQPWTGKESELEKALHGIVERNYPGADHPLQQLTNKYLKWLEDPKRKTLPQENLFDLIMEDMKTYEELKRIKEVYQ